MISTGLQNCIWQTHKSALSSLGFCPRRLSCTLKATTQQRISKHIIHRKLTERPEGKVTPLVILWPWLRAPVKAVDRYCDVYHDLGWDVLTVNSQLQHFTWPKLALPVAHEFMEAVEKCHPKGPLVVHGMSIGAFMYVVATDEIRRENTSMESRIVAQVCDSLVVGDLSNAVAEVLAGHRILQAISRTSLELYFRITKQSTWDIYQYYLEEVRERPVRVPTLVFSSLDDPFCNSGKLQDMINGWRELPGMEVTTQIWQQSQHAGHLRKYPEQYREILYKFMQGIASLN